MVAEDDDRENIGLGCALDAFREGEEVMKIINSLVDEPETGDETSDGDVGGISKLERFREQLIERWIYIFDMYQEQPHLLDSHLHNILDRLVNIIRNHSQEAHLQIAAQLLTHVFKVRGFKIVVRHLPHEVEDLEKVVSLLMLQMEATQPASDIKYVLLLWLSIIVLIPFNMSRFDSGEKQPLADRILFICKGELGEQDKCRNAAAFLASKFLTRPDVRETALPAFLEWALDAVTKEDTSDQSIIGGLMSLCSVIKHGKREDLLPFVDNILSKLLAANFQEHQNSVIRRFSLKLTQRLGLVFLKSVVAKWRYQRGARSLLINLNETNTSSKIKESGQTAMEVESEEEEEYDVPDSIEEIIECLLCGLRDKETVVRWTAAKGIGRVTGRLPKDLADEVVGSLLELFSERETDSAWHGGCLAIAELARRGLLLPNRLLQVVELLKRALVYDERKGSFSVGAHIRDAACYVCWSFARAYDPTVMKPFVQDIASGLLTLTVFDREVNCRRAASAAFQENVGRQGTFPHGIDILTTADYFAVGQRSNAYLNISPYIASFSEYTHPLMDHLVARKIGHWDPVIRDLAAKALNRLTHCNKEYMTEKILPQLMDQTLSLDLYTSHGAILAVGQVVLALSKLAETSESVIGPQLLAKVEDLANRLIAGNKLRGLSGELMRQAVSEFILHCSESRLPVRQSVVVTWREILTENLNNVEARVQLAAVEALPAFCTQYYLGGGPGQASLREEFVTTYVDNMIQQAQVHQRKGFALGLGALPFGLLKGLEDKVMHSLIRCTKITEGTEKWAEARRDAVCGLTSVACKFADSLSKEMVHTVFDCYLLSLEDYTLDKRGDVGAWVREAALSGIEAFSLALVNINPNKLPTSIVSQYMPYLAQQAVEKIDRTRGHAGRIFFSLLHASSSDGQSLQGIPCRDRLVEIFPSDADIKWPVESETFPLFVRLLHMPEYSERVLVGLIVSVGGLTERLVKNSSQCLFGELQTMDSDGIQRFGRNLLALFKQFERNDRVTVPLLKFLDQLFNSATIEDLLQDEANSFSIELFGLCKNEVGRCGDPNKLMAASDVFCQLLQGEDPNTRRKCLVQIAIFLCHKFPRLRKYTADKFYEALLTFSDKEIIPEDNLDEVMSLLSETQWDLAVEQLREIRNRICSLAGVPVPALLKKTT